MAIKTVISIAGFDPSSGAGISADLKVFRDLKTSGMAVVTALTVQNSRGVRSVKTLPADFIAAQLGALFDDFRIDAMKVGMTGSDAVGRSIVQFLKENGKSIPVVLDPVMRSSSGASMAGEKSGVIYRAMLPMVVLVTPNIEEASVLSGIRIRNGLDVRRAAAGIAKQGAGAVLVKGGHLDGAPVDILFDGSEFYEFGGKRHAVDVHGTGCHLSSAITAFLARGMTLYDSIELAKRYMNGLFKSRVHRSGGGVAYFL